MTLKPFLNSQKQHNGYMLILQNSIMFSCKFSKPVSSLVVNYPQPFLSSVVDYQNRYQLQFQNINTIIKFSCKLSKPVSNSVVNVKI